MGVSSRPLNLLQVVGELSPRSKDRVISLGEKLACVTITACLASKVSS